jgi:DNA-binding response OmpR family regulator
VSAPLNIVLIEDHERLRVSTAKFLRKQGHPVFELECVEEMDEVVGGAMVDLFIIDLNLPGEDGLAFTKRLRDVQPQIGIIMMTARSGSEHIARGYQEGADIYLVKPVDPAVLLGAIESIRRRLPQTSPLDLAFRLDLLSLCLTGPGGKITLNHAEAAVLAGLMRSPIRSLDIYQVSALMGQTGEGFNQSSIVVRIVRLRKKMMAVGASRNCLKNHKPSGYQLCISIVIL